MIEIIRYYFQIVLPMIILIFIHDQNNLYFLFLKKFAIQFDVIVTYLIIL